MKSLRSMILWTTVLALSGVFGAMPAILAQDEDRTTAGQVMDRDTLQKFVLSGRDYLANISTDDGITESAQVLQEEGGDWKHGNTFLIILEVNGVVRFHAGNLAFNGTDLSVVTDDTGDMVLPKMLAAAGMEDGGFVEYNWDDPSDPDDTNPKVCYAVGYTSALDSRNYLLVGGYYQDLSDIETDISGFPPPPLIQAAHVVDRETLRAFVHGAHDWMVEAFGQHGFDLLKLLEELRREGSPWRRGSTYIYVLTEDGLVVFHGARPDQEGRVLLDSQTVNDFPVVRRLIEKAEAGGGYVEYYWDDPAVVGDEDEGSAKVGYAEAFTVPEDFPIYAGQDLIVGSGFYKGNQMALDFAHFANGDSFSSDVVLVNLAATPIRPLVYFYGENGELIDPGSMVDAMGNNLIATPFGGLVPLAELPALGEITISTNGMGDLTTGSVKVVTEGLDSPIGGVLRFDAPGIGVAGVGASQAVQGAIIPVRRQMGGVNTGAALRNLSESELTLTCHLMMGGEMIETQPVTLPANGQDAMFISDLFEHDTSDFTGSMHCTVLAGERNPEFTGVAVEMDANNGIFTTLPVIPLSGHMTADEEMESEE